MGQVASSTRWRVATTIAGGVLAAPLSYVMGKIVEKWGILDPLANKIGGWLKINVPASAVGWTVALILFAGLYGLFLWRVWRSRIAEGTIRDASTEKPANSFVRLAETTYKVRDTDIVYEASLQFLQDARNVATTVEVFIAESGFSGWKWKRLRLVEWGRSDPNCGDSEQVHLVELRVRDRPINAAEEIVCPRKKSILEEQRARLNVRVTVTAAGHGPYVEERLFLWKGNEVFPMPLAVPATEQGDSIDFEVGPCVLWSPQ